MRADDQSGHGARIVIELFESCNPHFRHNRIRLGQVTQTNLLPMQSAGLAIRLIPKDTAILRVIASSLPLRRYHSDRPSQVPPP